MGTRHSGGSKGHLQHPLGSALPCLEVMAGSGSSLFQACLARQQELQLSEPTVSFHAMERAQTTLEDFVKSYFHWHQLGLEDIFRFLSVLVWVEATIYQMDEENEELALSGTCPGPDWRFKGWG